MNRDLILHIVIAAEAQLRRTERLAATIGDPVEYRKRIPPLVSETRRLLEPIVQRVNQGA